MRRPESDAGMTNDLAIPADAALGKVFADGLVAVAAAAARVERRLHRPVVGQVQFAPAAVVEFRARRAPGVAGLGEVIEHLARRRGIKILRRVGRVAKGKAPAEIHQQFFTRWIVSGKGGKRAQQQGDNKSQVAIFHGRSRRAIGSPFCPRASCH